MRDILKQLWFWGLAKKEEVEKALIDKDEPKTFLVHWNDHNYCWDLLYLETKETVVVYPLEMKDFRGVMNEIDSMFKSKRGSTVSKLPAGQLKMTSIKKPPSLKFTEDTYIVSNCAYTQGGGKVDNKTLKYIH